jgi:hypothetical protein
MTNKTTTPLRQTEAQIRKHHAGKGAMGVPPSTDTARAAELTRLSVAAERAISKK